MRSKALHTRWNRLSPLSLAIGIVGLVVGLLLQRYPASEAVRALAPDGLLDRETARFLDSLHYLLIAGALLCVWIAWDASLHQSFAKAATSPPRPQNKSARATLWIPVIAALACGLRIGIGEFSDIGLGDDGARVVWLKQWLLDPRPVWWGLWAPGHLYLHALAWLLVRDAVLAGILLSALACGGTAWILGRSVERTWGRTAGICAAVGIAILPVAVAYGAIPDASPVFAFLVVVAVDASARYAWNGGRLWLGFAWLATAFASWTRFETFLLIPGIVAPIWPQRRVALGLGLAALLPTILWHSLPHFSHGMAPNVVLAVRHDPGLQRNLISTLFTFLGGLWQGLTLPFIAAGALGVVRALRSQRGREWQPVLALHLSAFIAAAVLTGTGVNPRYFILAGSILAAYTGVWLGGVLERSKLHGVLAVGLVAVLLVVAPPLYSDQHHLWMRRNPALRGVVDRVAAVSGGQDVVWISDESAFFFACRVGLPVTRYHALSRGDSDPAQPLEEMRGAESAIACVRDSKYSNMRWDALVQHADSQWAIVPLEVLSGYRLYHMTRLHPPQARDPHAGMR